MEHRTCQGCGNEFAISPRGQHAKYCGKRCSRETYNARRKQQYRQDHSVTLDPRSCQFCERLFTPTTAHQRYCPPTDDDRARQTGQAVSKCARAAANQAYRSTTEQAECKHCTKTFDRTRGRSQHVYCSDRCHKLAKSLAKRIHPPKPRPHLHPIAAPRPGHDTLTDAEWADVLANDPCSYCYGTASGVDHIDPTSRDGTDTPDNWTASCHRCNGRKTSTPLLPFLNWDRTQREFQPWRELVAAHHRS